MSWLRYANQGAIRNQPISRQLESALAFLPSLGVTMEVFSGGQDSHGGRRTGSTRHDHGNAADVFFYKDGRRLDWSNPNDLPIFQEIVRQARANGVTGIGAGEGYMRPGSMHVGFGSEAIWGAGGSGANAPDWLREAFSGRGGEMSDNALAHMHGQPPQGRFPQQQNALAQFTPRTAMTDPRIFMTQNALRQL